MRQVIARIVDDFDFLEFSPRYGPATVCGHARIEGHALGIITNNGPLDVPGANKATHFIQACCQSRTPLLYLNNTTGYMVGREYEEAGMIKHGSKMIQAVTSATVPQITIYCGASFGAGNYGMCGRGFHPRFCFSWPNAKTAVMGGEQAAETMAIVTEAAAIRRGKPVEREKLDAMKAEIIGVFDGQMDVFSTSARLLDDGVIDPRDTRAFWPRCWRSAARRRRATRKRCSFRSRGHERRSQAYAVQQNPDRQSRRDRVADHAHRAPSRLRRGGGVFAMRIGTRCMCARRMKRCASARRCRRSPICASTPSSPRRKPAEPTPCIPAMASSPRMRILPPPAAMPAWCSSGHRRKRSRRWATRPARKKSCRPPACPAFPAIRVPTRATLRCSPKRKRSASPS